MLTGHGGPTGSRGGGGIKPSKTAKLSVPNPGAVGRLDDGVGSSR